MTGDKVTSVLVKNPFSSIGNASFIDHFQVLIYTGHSLETHISAVSIDDKPLMLKSFLEQNPNLKTRAEIVRFRYIRKDLAEIIFRLNDPFSNWILTAMFFVTIFLAYKTAFMEVRAYAYTDNLFKKYLLGFLKIKEAADTKHYRRKFEKYIAEWYKKDSRFRFMQALGPAVGFILTVSSLVQALHPATRSTDDLDSFLNGIHIAMISTFLGLLMRLIAIEASRVNDVLLDRAESLLFDKEPDSENGTS